MEYKTQDLIAGQLNNSFNQIKDCEIVKPSWKGANTYGDTFFVKKRKGIEVGYSSPAGDIVDSITIEGNEYVLAVNGSTMDVGFFNGTSYQSFGLSLPRTSNTPYRLIEGKSGQGEFVEGITIGDAFFDGHDKGIWDIATDYLYNEIVQYNSTNYICISANTGKQPDAETDSWSVYSDTLGGYDKLDPKVVEFKDVYQGGYLKLKLHKVGIEGTVLKGDHLLFDNNDSNLQGISTEVYEIEAIDNDSMYIFIRGTNLSGSRPYVGETVAVSSEVGGLPVIATSDKVISLHPIKSGGSIIGVKQIELFTFNNEVIDMITYNGVMFVLTQDAIYYSRVLTESNINIYPLDFFNDIRGGLKMVGFGKMLVLFGDNNAVITPINGTTGSVGYVYTDLNYNNDLYSKYSVLSTMGSLYVLQDDKQFVKLNIKSVTNIDYDVETENAISNVRGLFDDINGDVYMNIYGKDINILNVDGDTTYAQYNIEYRHWNTGVYPHRVYKVLEHLYGEDVYITNSNSFDDTDTSINQEIGFDFGGDTLGMLKQVNFVKLIFGLNEDILDYELEVSYQLGGNIFTNIVDLSHYPINMDIASEGDTLGDSQIGSTLMGESVITTTKTIGTFVSVTVGLGLTGTVFNFIVRSKTNGFIYGGGILGYVNKLPTVTEYNYKN